MAKFKDTVQVKPSSIELGLKRIESSLREAKSLGWDKPIKVTIEIE